jgi:hypothetical protein
MLSSRAFSLTAAIVAADAPADGVALMLLPSFFVHYLRSDFTLFGRIRRTTFFRPEFARLGASARTKTNCISRSLNVKFCTNLSPGRKLGD